MSNRKWHWPTEEGWIFSALLIFMATLAGGWVGFFIMLIFLAFINIIGNLVGL